MRNSSIVRLWAVLILIGTLFLLGSGGPSFGGLDVFPPASPTSPQSSSNGGPDSAPTYEVRTVGFGLYRPVDAVALPDRSLLVVTQAGHAYRIEENGVSEKVGDISREVLAGGERGVLGVELNADFQFGGDETIYLTYNRKGDGATVLVRGSLGGSPLRLSIVPTPLVAIAHTNPNHNGGDIVALDADTLLVSTGDSGGSGDPDNAAQNPRSKLGKILRIDLATTPPHVAVAAVGLRNPWRITFDSKRNELWIADVGQDAIEEIDRMPIDAAGILNFGWPILEGDECFRSARCTPPADYVPPLHTYRHGDLNRCAVIGGAVSAGEYLFGDFCSEKIFAVATEGRSQPRLAFSLPPGRGLIAVLADSFDRIWLLDDQGNVSLATRR